MYKLLIVVSLTVFVVLCSTACDVEVRGDPFDAAHPQDGPPSERAVVDSEGTRDLGPTDQALGYDSTDSGTTPPDQAVDQLPPPSGAFCENKGRVSMEAEHFASQVGYSVLVNSGASGGSVVRVGSSGKVDYKVQVQTGGPWHLWLRTYASHPEDNGLFVDLDGSTIKALSGPYKGVSDIYLKKVGWSWAPEWQGSSGHAGPITLQLSAGLHTLSIRKRKVERPLIDKIVLTTGNNTPSGLGPAETPCTP